MAPNGSVLPTGHTWLDIIWLRVLKWFLALLTGGGKHWPVDVVITDPLPACTYANGTSGSGATLTANANAIFPTRDGVAPFVNMLVLVTNESLGALNWKYNGYYQLTTLGSSSAAWVLTRVTTFDVSAEMIPGTAFGIKGGTTWGDKVWEYLGPNAPTVGTSALYFGPSVRRGLFRGSIPASRVAFSVNPTANDTLAIGGTTFKFVAALGAAAAQVQVLIGGNAAATLANVIAAINGDASNANWVEATTPFAITVVADAITATSLRIRRALSRGGRSAAGTMATTALTASVSGGASGWTNANLNSFGVSDADPEEGEAVVTVTSAMITAGTLHLEFPFTPRSFTAYTTTSAGVVRAASDAMTISGDAILVTFGGGASPNLQNTDILTIRARS